MPSIRVALLVLLALPLAGQLTIKEKPKSPEVKQANDSISELRVRAERGDASAQFDLGFSYAIGQGTAKDYAEAVKWFRKATEQGDVLGLFAESSG